MHIDREKILRIFIDIGIVAILISLYIQYGRPYISELSHRDVDAVRIADIDTLETAIERATGSGGFASATGTLIMGHPKTVYISIPSGSSTCEGLLLPKLQDGWQYACVSASRLRAIDGTGWLPVDLTKARPSFQALPIDPANDPTQSLYYAYVVSGTDTGTGTSASSTKQVKQSRWSLVTTLVTDQYAHDYTTARGSIDPARYERGTDMTLW